MISPRLRGTTENREIFDSISVIPFCQIRERGYGVHDNNEHIRTITIKHQELINTQELRGGLTRLNKFFQFLSGISASVKPPS
jgi:hypothetical protein